jgi:hypothetical protein
MIGFAADCDCARMILYRSSYGDCKPYSTVHFFRKYRITALHNARQLEPPELL